MKRLRLILFSLGCLLANFLSAQHFTYLNWNELSIDSILPTYGQNFDLGADFDQYTYGVTLEYPEFAPLTKTEVARVKALVKTLPAVPEVQTFVGVSRRKGLLDVQFVPLALRDGRFVKLTSCKIVLNKTPKATAAKAKARVGEAASRYASSSVLKDGKWVKIRVTDDGVYQLSPSALSGMGFKDASRVKLYGYGGHQQNEAIDADNDFDDLEEVPLYHGTNGLLFYANGVTSWAAPNSSDVSAHATNPYSKYAYYFLTEGDAPLSFPTDAAYTDIPANTYTTTPANALYEKDSYAWYYSGRRLMDGTAFAGTRTFNMSLPGIVSSEKATVFVATSADQTAATKFTVSVNDATLGTGSIVANSESQRLLNAAMYATKAFTTTDNLTENSTIKISQASGYLDYIRINYIRALAMTSTYLPFTRYGTQSAQFQISGANANTHVWRIGTKGAPTGEVAGTLTGSTYTVNVPTASERYVAVNVGGTFPAPTFVENVANQDLHAVDSLIDMVIIVPKSGQLTAEAERLAEAHRQHDGLKVQVVRADQIYNEFSSGTPDATAYRRYMKMLYDRAESTDKSPRYLLLFGDCAWDNRMMLNMWTSYHPDDFLLAYESEESFSHVKSYIMEDYFGLLDDGEGVDLPREKVDLGVGRFPVRTAAEARIMVDKAISYMNNGNAGAWRNIIGLLADDDNASTNGNKELGYTFMKHAESISQSISTNNPSYVMKRIYWDESIAQYLTAGRRYPTATKKIQELMNNGALMMNYTGHGAPYCLSHEQVLTLNDFKTFSSPRLPLWFAAACDVQPFDTQEDNIGETAVLNEKGAAIAFYSTTRTVYDTPNFHINRSFSTYILGSDENGKRCRLGDAVRLSKCQMIAMNSDAINKIHFTLLGDPALIIGTFTYKAVVDSINGQKIDADNPPTMSAGSTVRVSGHIENESGSTVPSFYGKIVPTVFDSQTTVTCRDNNNEDSPYSYTDRTKTIFAGSDSVRAGTFTFTFPVPMDINYSDASGLINLYAVNADKTAEAQGSCSDFLVGGTAPGLAADTLGPKLYVYLNTPEFADGGTVNATPYFVAQLSDTDGINTSGNGIGHDLELIIDGDAATTYTLNDYFTYDFGSYTSGQVMYSIPALADGKHTLQFRAWDVMNNSSSAYLNFVVNGGAKPQLFDVTCNINPATTGTTFIVSYDRPQSEMTFSLEVFDYAGRKLLEKTETGISDNGYYNLQWNLTNNGGMRLPAGVYLYRVGVEGNGSKRVTKTKKIIIVGNN